MILFERPRKGDRFLMHFGASSRSPVTRMEVFLKSCLWRKTAMWLKFHYVFFGLHWIMEDVFKTETDHCFEVGSRGGIWQMSDGRERGKGECGHCLVKE